MKINDIHGLGIENLQPSQTQGVSPASAHRPAVSNDGGVDVIELSDKARLMQKAGQAIAEAPEIRPEKVLRLQDAVQQGAYQVDPQKVANSIIAHLLQE
ncbi:MAG: flagellar biosynthesis anti-sigma factor FlgM [Deltaproteobacteria bacterium]|nr:flagellar biosynthesis anti-sigma factor FlgM [Deltaproteobacteria bacterium]